MSMSREEEIRLLCEMAVQLVAGSQGYEVGAALRTAARILEGAVEVQDDNAKRVREERWAARERVGW